MKTRSLLSLFACAALAVTLAGCGSSDDKAVPAAAKPAAPGPAEVAKKVCDALVSGDYDTFVANSVGDVPDKDHFAMVASMIKMMGVKVTVGEARVEGDVARVKTTMTAPGEEPGEDELVLRKVDGVWKAVPDMDDGPDMELGDMDLGNLDFDD